jgi:enterochelin esterase family protein
MSHSPLQFHPAALLLALAPLAAAQPSPGPSPASIVSPEVLPDRRVVFRLRVPQAQNVRLVGTDIPGNGKGTQLGSGANAVWEITMGPIEPGSYRYNFNVDGLTVIDPRNPATSESNDNTWSLVHVPGAEFMDTRDVPHGSVSTVTYRSSALNRFRRMHVYTPPGYAAGGGKLPVLYLLHGAGDSDASWPSVGRAGFILDNLIADKKVKPMIVVMPAGHTTSGGFRPPTPNDDFARDFVEDVMPYVEKNYRTPTDRSQRAIAGLSMGGNQSLAIAVPRLEKFGYVGVFSSGLIAMYMTPRPGGPAPPSPPAGPSWEEQNKAALENASARKGLKLLWFATGKEDFLLETSRKTVELFKRYGFDTVYQESAGGHTWINWRNYLNEFAPLLFR